MEECRMRISARTRSRSRGGVASLCSVGDNGLVIRQFLGGLNAASSPEAGSGGWNMRGERRVRRESERCIGRQAFVVSVMAN